MQFSETNRVVVIIGYGNALRSDDGVGSVVARRLEEILSSTTHDIRRLHQLTPELAEPISRAELVIFIDATHDAEPGEIRERRVEPMRPTESLGHHVSPERLLADARDLFGRCPQAYVFTIGGKCWGFSESLSPKVIAAVPSVIDRIVRVVARAAAPCMN